MKKITVIYLASAFILGACTYKSTSGSENSTSTKEAALINQLYIFQEALNSGQDSRDNQLLTNALYLTDRGNVIVTVIDDPNDTLRYFWGKYRLTDTTLTYLLTDEFYYPGRWDEPEPDFTKGQTRKYNSEEITLKKSESDALSFYRLIAKDEKIHSVGNRALLIPQGISYNPYNEKENEKFISWRFKEIPELATL